MLAFKGFMEDRVAIRASALTYFTLLSLVPIAAMGFGVAKGFGFDKRLVFCRTTLHVAVFALLVRYSPPKDRKNDPPASIQTLFLTSV